MPSLSQINQLSLKLQSPFMEIAHEKMNRTNYKNFFILLFEKGK